MRLTSSFAVFHAEPGEEALAQARWHAREGHLQEAEREYRAVLGEHPDLHRGWIELFELLRREARHEEALGVATEAATAFGPDAAMPLALQGAALAELGRVREAVKALEAALERDGNLALAWHELAFAAFRVGELSRALLALDRAFALEPHTDTLLLRGRVLREAGQYEAAEVAFEGAMQAADYDIPRREAEREQLSTRRAASLGGRRPRDFSARERLFVDAGTVALELEPPAERGNDMAALLARALAAAVPLVRQLGWHPAAVAGAEPDDEPLADHFASALGADRIAAAALDPGDRPLVVTVLNHGGEEWSRLVGRLARWRAGTSFALVQQPGTTEPADLAGTVRALNGAAAHRAAQAALRSPLPPPVHHEDASALAASPQAPWRRRIAAAG
jgi:tetratricopeptide (TPR) repeat protein